MNRIGILLQENSQLIFKLLKMNKTFGRQS